MAVISEGTKAPDFSLKDRDGKTYALKDFDTDYLVVYFYPKDNTPGCTIEANMFTRYLESFTKVNTTIIGISGGDEKSKAKFCEKYGLKILLLSDTDFSVSESYGVYGEKSFMGKTYMGISRVTFVLGKDRKVIRVFENVKPVTHAQEVLSLIKGL